MSKILDRMRAAQARKNTNQTTDNSIFPFWNMEYGGSSVIRLLPYEDPISEGYWTERQMINMKFVDPNDDTVLLTYSAPCTEMYDPTTKCKILEPVRALYQTAKEMKAAGDITASKRLSKIGGAHWKNRRFYCQGFVIKSGLMEEDIPTNPIRVFPFSKQLHQKIYNSIFSNNEDPFEISPIGEFTPDDIADLVEGREFDETKLTGLNFIIKKSSQGVGDDKYPEWASESNWVKTYTQLDDDQVAALAEHKMWDLTKRLPDRLTNEQVEVLAEMMQVSIDRVLNGGAGLWNPEWEQVGLNKPKSGKTISKSNGSAPARTATSTNNSAAETHQKLQDLVNKKRQQTAEEAATNEVVANEAVVNEDVVDREADTVEVVQKTEPDVPPAAASQVSSIAERIRDKMANQSA